jgi:hypothetical protein
MRAARFTKAEVAFIRRALIITHTDAEEKLRTSIVAKLDEAEGESPKGVAAGPIEQALVRTSRGKVVELASGPSGYGRASKMATAMGVTVADAEVVGAWLARQGWMREPTTILGVLNKWAEWLPRARATSGPTVTSARKEGFGD